MARRAAAALLGGPALHGCGGVQGRRRAPRGRLGELPAFIRLLNSAATVGLAVSVGFFVWRLFIAREAPALWRLRRRLILSYIFIGVVPALLIIAFFLFAAWAVTMNLSAYLFKDGYDDIVDDARLIAQAAAAEIGRERAAAPRPSPACTATQPGATRACRSRSSR